MKHETLATYMKERVLHGYGGNFQLAVLIDCCFFDSAMCNLSYS